MPRNAYKYVRVEPASPKVQVRETDLVEKRRANSVIATQVSATFLNQTFKHRRTTRHDDNLVFLF